MPGAAGPAWAGPRGCGRGAPQSHAYLHDDVKGQIEQQVADEDAQHVGREVPGPVEESKERAERGEE